MAYQKKTIVNLQTVISKGLLDHMQNGIAAADTLAEAALSKNLGDDNAGMLLYIGADGSVQPLVLGAGLEIVGGVLNVIGGNIDSSQMFYTADGSVFHTADEAAFYVMGG